MQQASEALERARQYDAAGSAYIAFCELIRAGFMTREALTLLEHWKTIPPAGQAERPKDTPC